MKVTFGMNTSQQDYPIMAHPNTHIFEFLLQSLRRQTFKNFELVIADVNYDQRSHYFDNHQEDFPIKHVKIKPNVWIQNNCCAISTTKNTFLLHAKGDIVISMGDCAEFDSKFIERTVALVEEGYVVSSLYAINQGPDLVVNDQRHPESGDIHGNVIMSMQHWELLNGYDEMYDGAKGVEDSDLGWRCQDVGIKVKLITPRLIYQNHVTSQLVTTHQQLKCQDRWWWYARHRSFCGFPANTLPLTDKEYEFIKKCYKTKNMLGKCEMHGIPCKFKNREELATQQVDYDLLPLYRHPSLIFNLKEDRKNPEETIKRLTNLCEPTKVKEYLDKCKYPSV